MSIEQELRPGAMLRHDSYRIERVLGQGGFGITYLATDLNLERKVAIKEFFPKDYCGREGATSHVTLGTQSASEFVNRLKAKFLKEARNIARFDHPGIIKIHAAFEENNTAYYVMDFIEGESLSELVKRSGPVSPQQAIRYIEEVGEALEYVHQHKINHLDIKPANIMVRRSDNRPILIDFGLSKQYDAGGNQTSTTPTGISHGYAPMEQYNAGGVSEFSPQTDLYSLAATLYFLVSGTVPPQAITLIEEPLTFPDNFPQPLRAPILKAMSASRRARHETVRQFINEITSKPQQQSEETQIPEFQNDDATVIAAQPFEPKKPSQPGNDVIVDGADKPKTSKMWLVVLASAAVVCALVIIFGMSGNGSSDSNANVLTEEKDTVEIAQQGVSDWEWSSPLGKAYYTGEVIGDSTDIRPNGKGLAKFVENTYKGNIYDGEFKDGVMDGQATYTLNNGDKFEGTYRNNKYDKGRYTIKSTGEYFEGTFKNGNPDKGTWYNSKGEKI